MSDLPRANKTLGQHWLTDLATLQYICEFADVSDTDTVLEVGPGLGTLTKHLSEHAKKVVAVEFDQKLALDLAATYANTNVTIVPDDILQYDLAQLPSEYKLVANIPYYLTSNLLRRVLESSNPPQTMVILVQKEVAERMAAKPGAMSLLSVSVQYFCKVELGEVVPAYLFTPPPKVDSQVIKLILKSNLPYDREGAKAFFRVVAAGFSQRRKKLVNSISAGLGLSKQDVITILNKLSIPIDIRPQELDEKQWQQLHEAIDKNI